MDDVFSTALKNQWRSLMAMIMAEYAHRVSRRSFGVLEEMLSLVMVSGSMLVLRIVTRAPTHHGMPMAPFLLSGMILYWMLRTTMFRVASLKNTKSAFKSNPRVTSLDVLVARAVLNIAFYLLFGFPIFLIMYVFGISPMMEQPVIVFFIMLLMGIWGFGLGLCFGALFLYIPIARTVVSGLMMVLMWISGIMFIWPEIPYMLKGIMIYNPIFHFMELMRTAYFSSYITPVGSWSFVLGVTGVTVAFGLMLERVTRKKAMSGTHRQGADDDLTEMAV